MAAALVGMGRASIVPVPTVIRLSVVLCAERKEREVGRKRGRDGGRKGGREHLL